MRGTRVALATAIALIASLTWSTAGGAAHRVNHRAAAVRNRAPSSRLLATKRADELPDHGNYAFLLKLSTPSTVSTYQQIRGRGKLAVAQGLRSQLQRIKVAQRDARAALPSHTSVLYETHNVLVGLAVMTDVHNIDALRAIRGVQAVYPIAPKRVTNSYAVPLQHAPQVWANAGDLGENSTIAIIDSGIDYTHADLGGTGNPTDYQAALASDSADPTYPDPNKIVGGFDFVGDNYDPDPLDAGFQPVPHPDNNPLDCDGHGTHVAGIAAGYGENTNGSTFTGDYSTLNALSTSDYQAAFRIGPGMAPKAHLLAYKVLGCEGATDMIGAGIDRAIDPNQDGDPSDHADVINMSLGSDFTSPQDGDSVEANLASQFGITVAIAAGNGGDVYDTSGSPGNAARAITVANSTDAYSQIDTLHATVNATPGTFGAQRSDKYDWTNDPDMAGNVRKLTDSTNLDGCDPLSVGDAAAVSGKIAFLEWTDNDDTRRCGSQTRVTNVANAGAIGAILADDEETFAAGIDGSATIPAVIIVKSAGDTLRNALALSQPVTITSTSAGDFEQLISANDDKVSSSSSRGIGTASDVKPDVSAVGDSVFSAAMSTGDQGVSFTGTSMASPMVAGLAALVKSRRKDWTPEQVKADIMNTAGQDLFTGDNHTGTKYAPNRVGAGRIDAGAALSNLVLAFVQNTPGAVSVSFGPLALTAATTVTKTVNVMNTSLHAATYAIAYHALTSIPGVNYQVSPATLTIPAASTNTFTVSLIITNPKTLTKTVDPTKSNLLDLGGGAGTVTREFFADASGRVVLTPNGFNTTGATGVLRVPVYAAPRPASSMTTASSLSLGAASVQSASLALNGTGINQGSGSTKVRSLVSGFELQASSGVAPTCSDVVTEECVHFTDERSADLKYVGVTSDSPVVKSAGGNPIDDSEAYFAITTQGRWRTPVGPQEFDILIDTNGDNVPDALVFNTRLNGGDTFLSELVDTTDPDPNNWFIRDDELINDRFGETDTALFDSDTMVLPVWLGAFGALSGSIPALPGFNSSHTRVHYGVVSFGESGVVDAIGVDLNTFDLTGSRLSTDLTRPGVEMFNSSIVTFPTLGLLLNSDTPGTSLTVRRDVANYNTDKAKGALIVHFQNRPGSKASVVALRTQSRVTLSLPSTATTVGHTLSATVTVTNSAGVVPTGTVTLRRSDGSTTTGTLSGGKVTLTWTAGARGLFTVFATYAGDSNYTSGTSATLGYGVG